MTKTKFVICTRNTGYEVSLELRKLYQVLPDSDENAHGQIRVVDESEKTTFTLPPTSFQLTFPHLWQASCTRCFMDT